MSEIPASLGDLTDVEVRLDARLSRLEKRQESDAAITDEKIAEIRSRLGTEMDKLDAAVTVLQELVSRVPSWSACGSLPEKTRSSCANWLHRRSRVVAQVDRR